MKRSTFTALAVFVWLAATLSGTWAMLSYANRPGDAGAAPVLWPGTSRLAHPVERPMLLVFVHPHCPCSRASLGELALLMTHCAGRLEARVIFVDPPGVSEGWEQTDLWRSAQAIPGVDVEHDADGRETQTFGTATSGDVLLYDGAGRLAFHGGITLARGHAGDNPGRSAIEAILRGEAAPAAAVPVFWLRTFFPKPNERTHGNDRPGTHQQSHPAQRGAAA